MNEPKTLLRVGATTQMDVSSPAHPDRPVTVFRTEEIV